MTAAASSLGAEAAAERILIKDGAYGTRSRPAGWPRPIIAAALGLDARPEGQ